MHAIRRHLPLSLVHRTRAIHSRPDILNSELPKPRLDLKVISENVADKSRNAVDRKAPLPPGAIKDIEQLYASWRRLSGDLNQKRHAKTTLGDKIRASGKDAAARQTALDEAKVLKTETATLEALLSNTEDHMMELALGVPNDTHPLSPIGPESAAVTMSTYGPPLLPADPKRDHVAIGKSLGMIDLEAGATVTGSSWYYLLNEGALLELALTNYVLSIALRHGFKPVLTPDVVRADIARRCGFNPRDAHADPPVSQMYHIAESEPELVLSGTAEVPLAGLFANRILGLNEVPTKLVGLGRAFRAEAGARGADTRGLYRVHQFSKLEMFVTCAGDLAESEKAMEEIRAIQTEIFQGLGFTFRVLDMPTEELGASAYRKYDMEAWMPGRGSWGEISSTSNCTDYQARRLHIRHRPTGETNSIPFAHTLNGTAAAIPRLIVTILENNARFDENGQLEGLDLPKVLQPFWPGSLDGIRFRWTS